jgi:hypothetical protein
MQSCSRCWGRFGEESLDSSRYVAIETTSGRDTSHIGQAIVDIESFQVKRKAPVMSLRFKSPNYAWKLPSFQATILAIVNLKTPILLHQSRKSPNAQHWHRGSRQVTGTRHGSYNLSLFVQCCKCSSALDFIAVSQRER